MWKMQSLRHILGPCLVLSERLFLFGCCEGGHRQLLLIHFTDRRLGAKEALAQPLGPTRGSPWHAAPLPGWRRRRMPPSCARRAPAVDDRARAFCGTWAPRHTRQPCLGARPPARGAPLRGGQADGRPRAAGARGAREGHREGGQAKTGEADTCSDLDLDRRQAHLPGGPFLRRKGLCAPAGPPGVAAEVAEDPGAYRAGSEKEGLEAGRGLDIRCSIRLNTVPWCALGCI